MVQPKRRTKNSQSKALQMFFLLVSKNSIKMLLEISLFWKNICKILLFSKESYSSSIGQTIYLVFQLNLKKVN
jgi:hypothetical protein